LVPKAKNLKREVGVTEREIDSKRLNSCLRVVEERERKNAEEGTTKWEM